MILDEALNLIANTTFHSILNVATNLEVMISYASVDTYVQI